jgi:hypothetical protein
MAADRSAHAGYTFYLSALERHFSADEIALWHTHSRAPGRNPGTMGDPSPKNKHKLADQKHAEHDEKQHEKEENAEVQHHHPDHLPDAEQVVGLEKPE